MPNAQAWEAHWGTSYDSEFKEATIIKLLDKLAWLGKLGRNILDVGAGCYPVTIFLSQQRHRIIDVDIAGTPLPHWFRNRLSVRADIESLIVPSFSSRKAMLRIERFLGVLPGTEQVLDAVILSEILNYIDGPKVLGALHRYIKPNGLVIVLNGQRGDKSLFSPMAPRDTPDTARMLMTAGYEIESMLDYDNYSVNKLGMALFLARRADQPIDPLLWAQQTLNQTGGPA